MKIRMITAAGLMLALAGCNTVSMPMMAANPVNAYWSGQSAGKFFAAFGPPISDQDAGSGRIYNWRGGYKTVHLTAAKAAASTGKKGAAGARTVHLSCRANVITSSEYVIRSVEIIGDMPGVSSSSYCAELLIPPAPASNS